jgi:nucleoid-associated protein YgaU
LEDGRHSRKTETVIAAAIGGALLVSLLVVTARDRAPVTEASQPETAALRDEVPEPEAAAAPEAAAPSAKEDASAFDRTTGRVPSFDLVRVEPQGSAVVAGFAEPGASIEILGNGAVLATAEADAEGNFVAFFDARPSSEPIALSMRATDAQAQTVESEDVVMVLPGPVTPAASDAQPGSAEAPEVAATAIVREGSVEVISSLDAAESIDADQVTLGSISYTEAGEIELSGAGPAEASLRVYMDNALVAEGAIGSNGRWLARLDDIETGLHRLRIDQLEPDGSVASRIETPFQRDLPTGPRPRPGAQVAGHGLGILATVQPGGTLWTIARTHYGSGAQYSMIVTANKDLIRNPNLIYPGQVLTIPGLDQPN